MDFNVLICKMGSLLLLLLLLLNLMFYTILFHISDYHLPAGPRICILRELLSSHIARIMWFMDYNETENSNIGIMLCVYFSPSQSSRRI